MKFWNSVLVMFRIRDREIPHPVDEVDEAQQIEDAKTRVKLLDMRAEIIARSARKGR